MQARDVKNNQQARQIVEQRGLSHIKVGVFDIDGVLRGKYMSKEKFFSALDNGFWRVKDLIYNLSCRHHISKTPWIPESAPDSLPKGEGITTFITPSPFGRGLG